MFHMFFFLIYTFFCFSFGCSFSQKAEEQEERNCPLHSYKRLIISDDKMTLHIKMQPEQIDLFTTNQKFCSGNLSVFSVTKFS